MRKRYWEDVVDDWAGDRPWIKHVGNADSGYTLRDFHPADDVKVIVIDRDCSEAMRSFQKYFSERPYAQFGKPINADAISTVFYKASRGLQDILARVERKNLFVASFEDLNSAETVAAMWNFICPEEPFFFERFFELSNLRVNPASEKVRV